MKLLYWLIRPRSGFARLRYYWWEHRNADKPWLTPGAVTFLAELLAPPMAGLEFGSGRSTLWFAKHLGELTSVEHHEGWFQIVSKQLEEANIKNVKYRLVPLDHPEADPELPEYHPQPKYIAVASDLPDGCLDLVVVDGHYRSHCIRASISKLRSGGLLLVDDANLWPGNAPPVPIDWPEVSRTTNGIKFTVIWKKPA